jgi:hypothetical protein
MAMHLLHVEALNFTSTLEDTDKLSVLRGGSLMARRAIKALSKHEFESFQLVAISTGASIGLFSVDCTRPEVIKAAVLEWLNQEWRTALTFGVAIIESDPTDANQKSTTAQIRFEQMQSLSVVPERESADSICYFTKIRAGNARIDFTEDNTLSEPAAAVIKLRHDFGRSEKQAKPDGTIELSELKQFYIEEISPYESDCANAKSLKTDVEKLCFTNDFGEIALNAPLNAKRLEGKLAVIYFDGDKFGSHAKCGAIAAWDDRIQALRKRLMAKILAAQIISKNDLIRLEVLTWGGDESLIVVPAWCGLALTKVILDEVESNWGFNGEDLHISLGLVFCHYKTPISRICSLAEELADSAKSAEGVNSWDYLVCESIDFPVEPLDTLWMKRLRNEYAEAKRPLRVPKKDIAALATALEKLPRGQIYALVGAMAKNHTEEFGDRLTRIQSHGDYNTSFEIIQKFFIPSDAANEKTAHMMWLHARELADYAIPLAPSQAPDCIKIAGGAPA